MAWLQIILALGMLLSGCDTVLYPRFEKAMWTTYIHLQDVRPGMTMSEVEGIMGPPQIKEEGDYAGGRYVFYFYLTHSMDYEGGETVRNGYTPLVFQRNRLEGIGKKAYRAAVDRPEAPEAPADPYKRVR
jgi:outer membrane protein assembly factor BamE (lipoprotein component of BamABCDE complex)